MGRTSGIPGIPGLWLGLVVGAALLAGCAGDQPKPRPSTENIQEDSDRFFEQLRREEEQRDAGPEPRR